MNVVGRVGSLISQGVYSVATPFHPFGGAVDVIVVQQQDGTFRSTPWYVRFGKFQGVLKGAEKVVRITVNGVEANFHMYLDNSGEAYFVREVDTCKVSEPNGVVNDSSVDDKDNGNQSFFETHKLEHSVSDSGVVRISRNEINSLDVDRIERVESDVGGFYDFQDEQSSLENSVELSEYGSNQFENLEDESFGESQATDSEVILVSVDGHVLTAPISASEQSTENVQDTPQFHLGPGEGTDFVEGSEEFYISQLTASTSNVVSDSVCIVNNDVGDFGHSLEVSGGEGKHVCQAEEIIQSNDKQAAEGDAKQVSAGFERKEVVKSCLELSELTHQVGNVDRVDVHSFLETQIIEEKSSEGEGEKSSDGVPVVEANDVSVVKFEDNKLVSSEETVSVSYNRDLDGMSAHALSNNPEIKKEQLKTKDAVEVIDGSSQIPVTNDEGSKNEVESVVESSQERVNTNATTKFEISLCGHELCAGMGIHAAAAAFDAHHISSEEFESSAMSIIKNENLIVRRGERYLPWQKAAPLVLGAAAFGLDLPVGLKDAIPVEQSDRPRENESVLTSTHSGRRWRLWPNPFRRVKTLEHSSSNSSNEEVFVDSESVLNNSDATPMSQHGNESPRKQLVRTNVPTTEQIASLNLKEGQNMIAFSFSTRVLGMQKVDAHIYLWKWNARIVISDVDGTITKSDVLGQFMPLVGKDWTQSGVAHLFSAIKENGYQLLFLSARAIVQAYLTRSFLLNLKQDGKALPSGPVVISPDGLFPSLFREVIRRAPHEFKIACLEDIKKLFPSDYNPFYAGFGNRDTDELSYRKIGIPKGKIFIINPKGEVAISHRIDVKSYTSLHTLVNDMFPPTSLVEQLQEDFNSWNYWRMPLPDIE